MTTSLKDFAASNGASPPFSVKEDLFDKLPKEEHEQGNADIEVMGMSLKRIIDTSKVKELNLTQGFGLTRSE